MPERIYDVRYAAGPTLENVKEAIQKPVFARIPNNFKLVSEFLNLGQPAAAFEGDDPIAAAMKAIARRIVYGEALIVFAAH